MKSALLLFVLVALSHPVFAHEGHHHGPKTTGVGKYGGVLAAIVDKNQLAKSHDVKLLYKAELVRSADRTVRVYLYDKNDSPLTLTKFKPEGSAVIEVAKNGKYDHKPFPLKLEKNHYKGQAPKAKRKPFNLEITLNDGSKDLFVSFENLD